MVEFGKRLQIPVPEGPPEAQRYPGRDRFTDTIDHMYRQHREWLTARLIKHVGCRERAGDLTQGTFLRLFALRSLDTIREPKAFLATIANGLLIDDLRRRDLERRYLESVAEDSIAPSSEDMVVLLDQLLRIDRMLVGLRPRTRRVFLMSRLEGLTYRQIAQQLGVSLSTVEKDMAQTLEHCYRIRYAE